MVLLLAAGACGDAPTISTLRSIEDPWSVVQPLMTRGGLPIRVDGEPAAAPQMQITEAVLRAVKGTMTWTATPAVRELVPGIPKVGLRAEFLFNTRSGDPCGAAASGGLPLSDGSVVLLAVLCDGPQTLVRVDARIHRIDGLSDRRFRQLVEQTTLALLSPQREHS